jgi:uncharacterized protein YybS (DUF2232 family)
MNAGRILIGVGAGIASALLLASIATRSPLAAFLMFAAPLPILIAGFGWGWVAAFLGAVVASVGLAAVTTPALGVSYFVAIGAPAIWIAYVAFLGRPAGPTSSPADVANGMEWYPVGRIVVLLAVMGALSGVAFVLQFGTTLEAYVQATRPVMDSVMRTMPPQLLGGATSEPAREAFIRFMTLALPAATALVSFLSLALNVWIAGRVVTRSGRSIRPWPDLSAFTFPTSFVFATVLAVGVSLIVPEIAGFVAGLFALTFLGAWMLLGLAVVHSISRGARLRGLMLFSLYLTMLVVPWALLAVAIGGLLEPMLRLREKAAARRGPPPVPPTT